MWSGGGGFGEAHVKQMQDDVLLHGEQRHAKQGQNQQLDRADFPQEGAVGDQGASHTEVRIDEAGEGGKAGTFSVRYACPCDHRGPQKRLFCNRW